MRIIMKGNHVLVDGSLERHYQCRCITIPPHIVAPSLSIEEIDDRWLQFSEYLAPVGQICSAPGQCSPDYMERFYRISHPFMSLTQPREPPGNSPVVHDDTFIVPDPPQQVIDAAATPEPPAPTLAAADVDMPRRVVDACQRIAKSLEHMINMRIVTVGTEAYTLTQHCLRLARGAIEQHNVYVRSRRRRDTQDT